MTSNPNIGQEQADALAPTWRDREAANAIRREMYEGGWGLDADAHDWRADHPLLQAIAAWNQRSTPTPAQVEPVRCSKCGNADMLMCDCSLPSRIDPAAGDSEAGRLREANFDKLSDDDPAFIAAWEQMMVRGYQYSQSNIDKVHLGWMMAHAAAVAGLEIGR